MTTGAWQRSISAGVMDCVVRRLSWLSPLNGPDIDRLAALGAQVDRNAPRATIISARNRRVAMRFIVSGWACQQKLLPDGRRQIFNIFLPGDTIGLGALSGHAELGDIVALTPVSTVDAAAFTSRQDASPAITAALANAALFQQSLVLDHLMRLGRQTALERTAHFLLELQARLDVVGLCGAGRFPLPLTQESLSDVLGISVVHLSRTLQQLRRQRLADMAGGFISLLDAAQLALIADYQPFRPDHWGPLARA